MDVVRQNEEEFKGGKRWLDILDLFVDYVDERERNYSLKVIDVIRINVHFKNEVLLQDSMDQRERCEFLNMGFS
jgi:hypothetical protein